MKTCEQAPADEIRVGRDRIRFKVTSEQSGGEVARTPGERMERFAHAAGELAAEEEVIALARAHGIEVTRSIEEAQSASRPA